MVGIYCILNKSNNKKYIGQSTSLNHRKTLHFSALRHHRHENSHLQNSFNKYGEESFEYFVLAKCNNNIELDFLERLFIKLYDSCNHDYGYNKETGGSLNKRMTLETRKKMSDATIGKNNSFYGKHHSKESRKKISEGLKGSNNPMYGKCHSEETRKKISESRQGEKNPNWNNSVIDKYGGVDFLVKCMHDGLSQRQIGEIIGIDRNNIMSYLKRRGISWSKLKEEVHYKSHHHCRWGQSVIEEYGGIEFIKECIQKGMTQEDVASIVGTERANIRNYLKRRNLSWKKLKSELLG